MDPLLEQYIAESRDCVQEGNDLLLKFESATPSADEIDRLFRALHTLKGGAGLFALEPVIRVTHAAEDILDAAREGQQQLSPELTDIFFAVLDQVGMWLDSLETQQNLGADAGQVATALQGRLQPFRQVVATAEQVAPPVTDTSWVAALPETAWLELTARDAKLLVAVIYTPDEACFFSGQDPLQLIRKLPGLCALQVKPRQPFAALTDFDVYQCQIQLFALSTAPLEAVTAYCARFGSEAQVAEVSPALAPATTPPDEAARQAFARIIQAQLRILKLPGADHDTSRLDATVRAIGNTLQYMKMPAAMQTLTTLSETARQRKDITPLIHFLESLTAVPVTQNANEGEPAAEDRTALRGQRFVKVEQGKIDALLDLIGELSVAKNGLRHLAEHSSELSREYSEQLKERYSLIDRITGEMLQVAMRIRLTPLSQVFQRLPRLTRDLAQQLDKNVKLVIEGEETEADKNSIELLAEPLLHMVRNSLDHGIETAAERKALGKKPVATVTVRAFQRSDNVIIEVSDDGRGISAEQVRDKALSKGLISREALNALDDEHATQLIFMPGFSTAQQVSDVSGRGVGMDVVKTTIERIGGKVSAASIPGKGTTISLTLPLVMAVSQVMTVTVAGQRFGVPMGQVVQTTRIAPATLRRLKKRDTFTLRGEIVPLLRLRSLLGLPAAQDSPQLAVLLTRTQYGLTGLAVDDFSDPADVVMKPMEGILRGLGNYAGNALLADGSVLLVLDLEEVVHGH